MSKRLTDPGTIALHARDIAVDMATTPVQWMPYYFDAHGDVPLRPSLTLETKWDAARYDLNDYEYA